MKKQFDNLLEHIQAISLNTKSTFSVEDFCRYSGLSKSFIYKLTANHKIPFSCPTGKLIYFKREDCEKFLLSNPIYIADDIEQEAINYLNSKLISGGRDGKY